MEKKESKYYQGQKETYRANQDQKDQDYVFYLEGWRYFYDEETTEKLEEHIRPLYYQFRHRKKDHWTPAQEKERTLLFAETIFVKGSYIERFKDKVGYIFYCFEPVIGGKDKKFSGTETVAEKHKSEEYDGFRHLFNEDVETITIKNAEEWQKFYDQWIQKQNAHFLDRK